MKKFISLLVKYWPIFLAGLVLRLILMPVTLHSDLWAISFAQNIFSKGVINVYDYLGGLSKDTPLVVNYGQNFFTYPPLAYFVLGFFGFILKPFFNQDFVNNLAVNLPSIYSDQRLFLHLFLSKLPYLFFDFGVLFLLTQLFKEEKDQKTAMVLWIFNPFNFYTSYMVGQFDILPVFFVLWALFLIKKEKPFAAAICLGIGGAFKMFPLFFIPFLAFSYKDIKKSLLLLTAGGLPYLLSILPFVNSGIFRQTVLFSNQSQKMLFAKIMVSGAEYLSLFVVFYVFLLVLSVMKKLPLWKYFFMVLLLLFGLTHYHPQWYLWVSPFFLFFWIENPKYKYLIFALFFIWLSITLLFEPSLSISLFGPVNHSLLAVKPLSETFNRFYNVFEFKSLIRSFAAGISLAISALLFKDEKTV